MDKKTLLLVLIGFALRLALIFPGPLASKVEALSNKADLRNYYWPAQQVLSGENPYVLWASGAVGDFRSDMAPLELLIYAAAVRVWNDPRSIQLLFAVFDAVNIWLLGLVFQSSAGRFPVQLFYALSPLTLYNLALVPEDKTIVLTLTLLIFYLLLLPKEKSWGRGSWRVGAPTVTVGVAAVLASFKWLSFFYLVPLLIWASQDVKGLIKNGLLFGVIVLLLHLPWAPSWSIVYAFRLGRVMTPIHIAPAVLLKAVGWFDRTWLLAALALSLLLIYGLFWFKRIDIFETVALSVAAGILWTPDMDPVHLSIVVFCFLLIVNWTSGFRQVIVWGAGSWVAAVYAISTHAGWTRYGLPDLQQLTGAYGSISMILWSYVLFAFVMVFYAADKWRGRALGRSVLLGEMNDTTGGPSEVSRSLARFPGTL